jgi:hypothetical protein
MDSTILYFRGKEWQASWIPEGGAPFYNASVDTKEHSQSKTVSTMRTATHRQKIILAGR